MKLKSTKFLFLYRSFLFKYVNFTSDNKNLKLIVTALNIKNNKKRLEYVFDETIKHINKYYEKDLCKFKDGKCIVQRKRNDDSKNGCCKSCHLVTDKGCPSKNVACKLIYCKTALDGMKKLKMKDIDILKCISLRQRIILRSDYFRTKEEVIKDMRCSLILYGLKILFEK